MSTPEAIIRAKKEREQRAAKLQNKVFAKKSELTELYGEYDNGQLSHDQFVQGVEQLGLEQTGSFRNLTRKRLADFSYSSLVKSLVTPDTDELANKSAGRSAKANDSQGKLMKKKAPKHYNDSDVVTWRDDNDNDATLPKIGKRVFQERRSLDGPEPEHRPGRRPIANPVDDPAAAQARGRKVVRPPKAQSAKPRGRRQLAGAQSSEDIRDITKHGAAKLEPRPMDADSQDENLRILLRNFTDDRIDMKQLNKGFKQLGIKVNNEQANVLAGQNVIGNKSYRKLWSAFGSGDPDPPAPQVRPNSMASALRQPIDEEARSGNNNHANNGNNNNNNNSSSSSSGSSNNNNNNNNNATFATPAGTYQANNPLDVDNPKRGKAKSKFSRSGSGNFIAHQEHRPSSPPRDNKLALQQKHEAEQQRRMDEYIAQQQQAAAGTKNVPSHLARNSGGGILPQGKEQSSKQKRTFGARRSSSNVSIKHDYGPNPPSDDIPKKRPVAAPATSEGIFSEGPPPRPKSGKRRVKAVEYQDAPWGNDYNAPDPPKPPKKIQPAPKQPQPGRRDSMKDVPHNAHVPTSVKKNFSDSSRYF